MRLRLRNTAHQEKAHGRRGRPTKFGEPSQAVVMTLPKTVLEWLKRLDPDPAVALVGLFERTRRKNRNGRAAEPIAARLVPLPLRRALIVVEPALLKNVTGVRTIPLAGGRALVSLGPSRGLADLEVAIQERRRSCTPESKEWTRLGAFEAQLARWRRDPALGFSSRSIIVAERKTARPSR